MEKSGWDCRASPALGAQEWIPGAHTAFVLGAAHPAGLGERLLPSAACTAPELGTVALTEPAHLCPICFLLLEASGENIFVFDIPKYLLPSISTE